MTFSQKALDNVAGFVQVDNDRGKMLRKCIVMLENRTKRAIFKQNTPGDLTDGKSQLFLRTL